MAKNYDIIIVGAGIFGSAIFHELSKQCLGKILLIEKKQLASGTTGQSGGLIRKFFNLPHLWQFATTSFDYYRNFAAIVGNECGFRQTGCYYLLPSINHSIQQQYDELNTINYPIENPIEIMPHINNETNDKIFYEPLAGCIDTYLATNSWINAGLNTMSHFIENTFVNELIIHNEQIQGVKTNDEIIYAKHVILPTGAWGMFLLAHKNIHPPTTTKAFQYHRLPNTTSPIKSAVIDMRNQLYLVPGTNEIITGILDRDIIFDANATLPQIDLNQKKSLQKSLAKRFSWINQNINLTDHIAIDAFNEDTDNLFGEISPIEGLYHVAIGSGGGIKIAPAVAKHITRYFINTSIRQESSSCR